jgi:hypothetical protein
MNPHTKPTPIDPDELPDDMDLDRTRAGESVSASAEFPEGMACLDLDVASAQRPPEDS